MKIYNYYHLSWSSAFAIMDFHGFSSRLLQLLRQKAKPMSKNIHFLSSNQIIYHAIIILRQFNSPFLFSARLPISGGDDL